MNDDELYRLDPGSGEAREQGCICDPQEPKVVDGQRVFTCETNCPAHGLAVAKALVHQS